MVTAITSQLQDRLRGGGGLLASGPQTGALVSGNKKTATAAINKTALATGSTTVKTGVGASLALGAGTITGTILGILIIGLVAYGVNVIVRTYIK